MTYPDGRQVTYERDAAGRVVRVLTEKDGRIRTVAENIACLPFGPVKGWAFGNGIAVTRTLDERYRPVRFTAGAALDYSYSSDAAGRITAVADLYDPTGDRVFGYDDLDRLIHAQGAWGVLDYTYDKTGNRLSRTADGQVGTYVYQPGTSRLLSVDEVFPAQHQYGYDDADRVVSADSLILAYNAAGRLSSVVQTFPLGQTPFGLYTYNALGERVKKTAGAATTVYHYDRDGRLIAESDPSGRFSRTYVYLGDERLAAYEPVGLSQAIEALRVLSGEESAGAKDLDGDGRLGAADALAGLQMVAGVRPLPGDLAYYFVNDHLGTPVKVVNQAGIVVWGGTTLPFGAVEGESRVFDNRFRFAGQYYDAETGLHYNYHRYYDPGTGRYLTADPIGLTGGTNPYNYTKNNPLMMVDPLGLEVRVYSSDAFGIPGFNHAFVYSTELKSGKGRAGKSGFEWGNGIGDLDAPYVVVKDLKGLSESEFMQRIEAYPEWNKGPWIPWIDDCHAELAEAFKYAGVPYPGALNDRIDVDDIIDSATRRAWQNLHNWFERLLGENEDPCK